jgi:hypothetical protein
MYDYDTEIKLHLYSYRLKTIQWKKKCALCIVVPQTLYLGKLNISKLTKRSDNILTIAGGDAQIVGFGKATITLHMGTQVTTENALLYPDSTRTLLSYRDISKNELHVIIHEENNEDFFLITKQNRDGHDILERISSLPSRLHYTHIKVIPHVMYQVIF